MTIERYEHHGVRVAVQAHLKGRHAEHCLCWQDCEKFKPSSPLDNCEIAQHNYEQCVRFHIVTPVFECPQFSVASEEEQTVVQEGLPARERGW